MEVMNYNLAAATETLLLMTVVLASMKSQPGLALQTEKVEMAMMT